MLCLILGVVLSGWLTTSVLAAQVTIEWDYAMTLPATSLRVTGADSQETTGEQAPATNAADGKTTTFWHTAWSTTPPAPYPHWITLDLGQPYAVVALSQLPRQDGGLNGSIAQYKWYLSGNGTTWGQPVASGTWDYNASKKTTPLAAPTQGRYVKLEALSEGNGRPFAAVAELGVAALLTEQTTPESQGGFFQVLRCEPASGATTCSPTTVLAGARITTWPLLYTDQTVQLGHTYCYTVTATDKDGHQSPPGRTSEGNPYVCSTVAEVTTIPPPINLGISPP